MPVKVLGHWEIGWDTPWQEYSWWKHPLMEFGVDEFMMIPQTGIKKDGILEYTHIEDAFSDHPEYTVVFVDENAENELLDFVHPENALYVLGKTGNSPYANRDKAIKWTAVKIPTNRNQGGFWAHQAISLILYDRFLKEKHSTWQS